MLKLKPIFIHNNKPTQNFAPKINEFTKQRVKTNLARKTVLLQIPNQPEVSVQENKMSLNKETILNILFLMCFNY